MKRPRKIVDRMLVRSANETNEQWTAALEHHRIERLHGHHVLLRHAIGTFVSHVPDGHVLGIAEAVLTLAGDAVEPDAVVDLHRHIDALRSET